MTSHARNRCVYYKRIVCFCRPGKIHAIHYIPFLHGTCHQDHFQLSVYETKVVNNLGVYKYDVDYMGNFHKNNVYLYGYHIELDTGRVTGRNLVWVHKKCIANASDSLPF